MPLSKHVVETITLSVNLTIDKKKKSPWQSEGSEKHEGNGLTLLTVHKLWARIKEGITLRLTRSTVISATALKKCLLFA